ncbi:hypothetical protein EAF04_005337 [Stromatinia cepivora]|nr:hypothetical protein EAF04_005337 [Stromatinia cepivora]
MENGFLDDQNFYSRPLLQSDEAQSPAQSQSQFRYSSDLSSQHRHTPASSCESPHLSQGFDFNPAPSYPPKLPLLTTSNLQAIHTNGYMNNSDDGGEPDDFYRDYQSLSQTNGSPDQVLDMAATASDVRPTPSTVRSNNTSNSSKQTPSTSRTTTRPPLGSNLSPVESNQKQSTKPLANGYGKALRQPSVKDLLKRFDQNNDQSLPMPRKPVARAKDGAGISSGYMRDRSIPYTPRVTSNPGPTTTSSSLRAGAATREPGLARVKSPSSSTRAMQRPRFATEDQHSTNAFSGSPRNIRTRNAPSTKASPASKSMNNLSRSSQSQIPPSTPEKRPLFGEILTFNQGATEAGYGIPTATRRTSESGLPSLISTQQLSRTDVDISPTSPTAWYLGVTPSLGDVKPNKPRRTGHNRAHSDFADTKVNTMHNVNRSSFLLPESPVNAKDSDTALALDSLPNVEDRAGSEFQPAKLSSRLPVALRRLSSQSDTSSSPSTRASSPLAGKRAPNSKFPRDYQPWSPTGRSMTSANRSTPQNSRVETRSPEKSPSNGSLKAYISAPPAKNSPPLRSSRPRQPVSAASTTSSRKKVVDGSASPHDPRAGMKVTRTGGAPEMKGRKAMNTEPVNYAARRAQITRAYTRSIHESELQKIRAANTRRLNEKIPQITNGEESSKCEQTNATPSGDHEPEMPSLETESLQILTNFESQTSTPPVERQIEVDQDSPTLGVTNDIPGAFIDEHVPMSAISNISATTFIENEAQTEGPRLARNPSIKVTDSVAVLSKVPEVDDTTSDCREGSSANSLGILIEATLIEAADDARGAVLEEPIGDDVRTEAISGDSPNATAYDEPATVSVTEPPSPKTLISETFDSNSIDHINLEAAATASINHGTDQPTGLGSNDKSAQQLVDIPIKIEEDTDESHLHLEPSRYSGESPRLELPALRSALAEFISPPETDRQPDLYPPTDIDYESSEDIGAGNTGNTSEQEDLYGPSYDQNRELYLTPDTYRRESRHSAWTDISVATTDDSAAQDENQKWINTKVSLPELQKGPTPPPKLPPSPEPSVLVEETNSMNSSGLELPPLTSHNGFGLGFDPDTIYSVPTIPVWASLTPPPITEHNSRRENAIAKLGPPTRTPPPPTINDSRPGSSVYQTSQNTASQHTESRCPSDDLYSPRPSLSTPRSSMQISQEDISLGYSYPTPKIPQLPLTEEEQAIAKKKSARLFTRRKIIEEIIDTEAAYLKDMNVVEEIYKGTAEACPKLDFGDIKTIFRNTDEIITFSTALLDDLKKAGAAVYTSKSRARQSRATGSTSATTTAANTPASLGPNDNCSDPPELNDFNEERDRKTFIGYTFGKHLRKMQEVYTEFLKNSELAGDRLRILSADPAVSVWLIECNNVAKDLTAAWDLDALMVKPVQRITRYQLLIDNLVKHTAEDHPDFNALTIAGRETLNLLQTIDKLKERIQVVGKIVGRKRKESEVRLGLAKAFGRRSEKLTSNVVRPHDDEVFVKLHEKFGHDYLRLQVVMRDIEYYTRQVATWVNDFLRFLSAMELIMRHSPSSHPEMESRWSQFNLSMRDMGSVALENHVAQIRKEVIDPIEAVIRLYTGPTEFMKKRSKRRVDYEKWMAAKANGKKSDDKLLSLVKEYDALNETLKTDLPRLSALTSEIGRKVLARLICNQTSWYYIWQEKVKTVLDANQIPMSVHEIVQSFDRDYKYVLAQTQELRLINGTLEVDCFLDRLDSTPLASIKDNESIKTKGRLSDSSARPRGLSSAAQHDTSPSLPTPDFVKRHSGQFSFSPILANAPGFPAHAPYLPAAYSTGHSRAGSGSPAADASAPRLYGSSRPSTSRSITSDNGGIPRISTDLGHRRESSSTQASASYMVDGPLRDQRPFSGIFHSAMPLPDGPEDSARSSRASSMDRTHGSRYNVIYLAASLFEFNIEATKKEAGYPYLTYSAGEIFDVIGEKGELWLAKNQDDGSDQVGWIWSKHFARLAMD